MKTRIYTVHLHDNAEPVLIKQGFNWPAFFLAVPWALFHRMWWVAAALVVLQIVLAAIFITAGFSEPQQAIVSIIVAIAIATAGDELRRDALTRRGYRFADVVVEENTERALRRFLDARPELAARLAKATL